MAMGEFDQIASQLTNKILDINAPTTTELFNVFDKASFINQPLINKAIENFVEGIATDSLLSLPLDKSIKDVLEFIFADTVFPAINLVVVLESLEKAITPFLSQIVNKLPFNINEIQIPSDAAYPQLAVALTVGIVGSGAFLSLKRNSDALDEIPTAYDIDRLEKYYKARPLTLYSRVFQVVLAILENYVPIYLDGLLGQSEQNVQKRAEKVKETVSSLGAAYIKVGQACSIRPDLFPEPYLLELQKLQDQVPPFSSEEALQILTEQLGKDPREVFTDVSAFEKPLAAASLGQVYKATLKDGTPVAVKVQRPNMLESVTLDLYVIRQLLLAGGEIDGIKETCLSLVGVIDAWAVRFVEELDYMQEAANAKDFSARISECKSVKDVTITPKVFDDLTSRYVLVSEWIEGQRLSAIDASTEQGKKQVLTLVNILLTSYLTQLLETGLLHADPHPGNFLLTPDGRVCILDYGLMTEVEEDRRLALIEYITHLNSQDYEASLTDLTVLGFIPKEIDEDPEKKAIVVPLLATVLEQLSNGGGAKAVSVESVGNEIEELSRQYPIVIPAYFGLIVRAFSTLEGIGLSADPKFSIVNACFPYLCRRLLTDDSPRVRKMLKTWLYGQSDFLDTNRVDEILEGYRQFTLLTDEASKQREGTLAGDFDYTEQPSLLERVRKGDGVLDPATQEALELLFSKDGNYVQDLVVEELVRITDAVTRENVGYVLGVLKAIAEGQPIPAPRFPLPLRLPAPNAAVLGFAPIPRAPVVRLTERLGAVIKLTNEDEETLNTVERLSVLVRKQTQSSMSASNVPSDSRNENLTPQEIIQISRALLPVLQTIQPGVQSMGSKYIRQLSRRALLRLADDLNR